MIIPMKKVTILCLADEAKATLDELQNLGVVHPLPLSEEIAESTQNLQEQIREVKATLSSLKGLKSTVPATTESSKKATSYAAPTRIAEISELQDQANEITADLQKKQALLEEYRPFGNFDANQAQGLNVKLAKVSVKKEFPILESGFWQQISEDSKWSYGIVLDSGSEKLPELLQEVALPETSLTALETSVNNLKSQRATNESKLLIMAGETEGLVEYSDRLQEKLALSTARDGLGADRAVVYLQGFVPERESAKTLAAAKKQSWGIVLEEPSDEDNVPSLIEDPKWVAPIKSVFAMIGLTPGYKEIDISSVFYIFFSIFFAILIGDAGYGALFLVLTLVAKHKFKDAPSGPFTLFMVLSICTIIWGMLTGTYFGIVNVPAVLGNFKVTWLNDENNLMLFCFALGAIHLTIAHIWNAIRIINSLQALAQLGWILLTWTMYYAARMMILGIAFPALGSWLLLLGFLLVLFFMTPKSKLKTEWHGFVMLPLDIIGNFVDVVSYIRLFAVGSASVAVAQAFNEMAVGNGIDSIWAGLMAALILLLGHGLNIILGAMAILVHGVRLNTLEFSGHIGMQWTGKKYNPLARTKKPVEAGK